MVFEANATDNNATVDSDRVDANLNRLTHRHYAEHVADVFWLGETPWHLYGRILRPVSMPHVAIAVDREAVRRAVASSGALLAYWTSDWDGPESSEWWWTSCDQPGYEIDGILSSGARRDIRRGQRRCDVRRLAAEEFSRVAYPVYRDAQVRYGRRPPTEMEYSTQIESLAAYAGTHLWAAFIGDRLAAFAICEVVDGAVLLSSAKSDPLMNADNPNAALFYELTHFYLNNGASYVTNGSRTLLHPTTINDYLERLGYRKVYCRLNVLLSSAATVVDRTRLRQWGPKVGLAALLGTRWAEVEGFDQLVRISRTFE